MRIFAIVIAISAAYVGFCGKTLGYYVEPHEWFTGSYQNPAGHPCLAHTDTCRKWFPNNYIGGDSYSYDDGAYYDDEPTQTRHGKL